MSKRVSSFIKWSLFCLSCLMMWGVLYVEVNTHHGVFTHNALSGALLVMPILILNLFGGHVFSRALTEQNNAMPQNKI